MLNDTVILVAEENEAHFQVIQNNLLLTYAQSDIIRFKNGQDVLDYLFRNDAQAGVEGRKKYILLLDMSASEAQGLAILKKIKQDRQMKKIPVIILTEADDPHTVEQCYNVGSSTYIVKSKEYRDFEETIQKVGQFLSVVETASIQ